MDPFMLDTDVSSHMIKGEPPEVMRRVVALPIEALVISAVTHGELMSGLAKRKRPKILTRRVEEFLLRVDVLDWTRLASQAYGDLRADCESRGIVLAPLDMMIAAHAMATGAVLLTLDKSFDRLPKSVSRYDWRTRI